MNEKGRAGDVIGLALVAGWGREAGHTDAGSQVSCIGMLGTAHFMRGPEAIQTSELSSFSTVLRSFEVFGSGPPRDVFVESSDMCIMRSKEDGNHSSRYARRAVRSLDNPSFRLSPRARRPRVIRAPKKKDNLGHG